MSKLTSPMARRVWSRKPAMKRRKRQASAKFVAMPKEARMAPALLWPRSLHHAHETRRLISVPIARSRAHVFFRQTFGNFSRAGIAEASRAQRNVLCAGELLDAAVIQQVALRIVEIERHRSAARLRRGRAVDAHHGAAIACGAARAIPRAAIPSGSARARRSSRCRSIRGGAAQFPRRGSKDNSACRPRTPLRSATARAPALHRREIHRAAGEPRPPQFRERRAANRAARRRLSG